MKNQNHSIRRESFLNLGEKMRSNFYLLLIVAAIIGAQSSFAQKTACEAFGELLERDETALTHSDATKVSAKKRVQPKTLDLNELQDKLEEIQKDALNNGLNFEEIEKLKIAEINRRLKGDLMDTLASELNEVEKNLLYASSIIDGPVGKQKLTSPDDVLKEFGGLIAPINWFTGEAEARLIPEFMGEIIYYDVEAEVEQMKFKDGLFPVTDANGDPVFEIVKEKQEVVFVDLGSGSMRGGALFIMRGESYDRFGTLIGTFSTDERSFQDEHGDYKSELARTLSCLNSGERPIWLDNVKLGLKN